MNAFVPLNSSRRGAASGFTLIELLVVIAIIAILAGMPADAKVIPGHGKVSTPTDLRLFRDTIAETVEYVEKGIAAGKTSAPLEKYRSWSAGAQNAPRWFDAVYHSLAWR